MSLTDHEPAPAPDAGSEFLVESWRLEQLLRMGYPQGDAVEIALSRVDIHELEHLIGRGCPPLTAARILL